MKFKALLLERNDILVKNYIGIKVSKPDDSGVPDDAVEQKRKRDGDEYHITLIRPPELRQIFNDYLEDLRSENPDISKTKAKKAFKQLWLDRLENLTKNWRELGTGYARKGSKEVWFKVIDWPAGDRIRKNFGLPPTDFHITLGFRGGDIYDVRKDKSTLI